MLNLVPTSSRVPPNKSKIFAEFSERYKKKKLRQYEINQR